MATGIVGSVRVELEKSYRVMLLKIANELTFDDCQQIAFGAKLPSPTCQPEPGKPSVRIHLMSTLESLGHVSPLKLDFLEQLIEAIGKRYLLKIIERYKKSSLYKEAKRRLSLADEQDRRKKKRRDKSLQYQIEPPLECSANETERICKLQESYATLLTQFSQMALSMRSAIETCDLTKMEEMFLSVASDGDAIARTLRENLSATGIKCDGSPGSSSSDGSGEEIATKHHAYFVRRNIHPSYLRMVSCNLSCSELQLMLIYSLKLTPELLYII